MKRSFAAFVFLLVWSLCFFNCDVFASAKQARILEVRGGVQLKASPSAEWVTVQKGAWVEEGAELVTGPDASCYLALADELKSVVKVQSETKVVLSSLDPVMIDLKSGKMFSLVRELKKNSSFQVKTPTAVAGVRGTGWEQSPERVSVFENTVNVKGLSGQESDVQEGKGIDIHADGSFGNKFDVSSEDKAAWKEFESEAQLFSGSSEKPGESDPNGGNSGEQNFEQNVLDRSDDILDAKDQVSESKDQTDIDKFLKPDKEKGGGY